jgi:hypothetical protein
MQTQLAYRIKTNLSPSFPSCEVRDTVKLEQN